MPGFALRLRQVTLSIEDPNEFIATVQPVGR